MIAHAHNLRRLRPARPTEEVRSALEALLLRVDRRGLVERDPVEGVHRYEDPHDQEVAGIIVSGLAYGRVDSIRARSSAVLSVLGPSPARAVDEEAGLEALDGFVYRFQRGDDLPRFLRAVGALRRRYGSLGALLSREIREEDTDIADAASRFVGRLRAEMTEPVSYGLRYMVPDPGTGGAAKRLFLYLRWMTRGPDGLDLGAWQTLAPDVRPSRLVVPLDTHISRIARYLGWTRRAADDLRTAREITHALAQLDPDDPVRYDMALCHLGISGACPRHIDLEKCAVCSIRSVCRVRT